jgi:hypothetical protein
MDKQDSSAVVQATMRDARWKKDRPSAPHTLAAKQSKPLRKKYFYERRVPTRELETIQ